MGARARLGQRCEAAPCATFSEFALGPSYLPPSLRRLVFMTPRAEDMKDERFRGQNAIRGPWRSYLDGLVAYRRDLHRYCQRLTGNVWDAEDLMQDTLLRVFGQLGRNDARLANPRAYLIRSATNLWIDRMRQLARDRAALTLEVPEGPAPTSEDPTELRDAARRLFEALHPQERAAIVLKDVFDLSLKDTASLLGTSEGAVKAALHRARGRLDSQKPAAALDTPPPEIVERFMVALANRDLATMRALCSNDLTVELVGGAQTEGFDNNRNFFRFAHMVMPRLGLGTSPRWERVDYEHEPVVLGFRTQNGVEGLNEVHRLETVAGRVQKVRCYCFCPETLLVVATALGCQVNPRPYRSPTMLEAMLMIIGVRRPVWAQVRTPDHC